MIFKEYCNLDTCKLLKEAGYPDTLTPLQSQAMRWLRDDCHLAIVIEYTKYNGWEYTLLLDYDTAASRMVCSVGADTYEAAAEAGIRAACEYLLHQK